MVCVPVTCQRASTTSKYGEIGKSLAGCEKLPVVSFTPIECTLCEVTNKKDLSTDQLYLMKICEAINCGHCRETMLANDRNHIRKLALRRILKTRKVKRSAATTTIATDNIRIFKLPAFDLCAMDYVDLIKWENVIEPSLTERFS
ncbi:hypothetical protein AVEN_117788-1 [Araneus ventricosus]|uniref:Uncharacterized protein n=1 Tax=Araneus ventricosus TaxID=182803 RepID=A0A4Y2B794_ARAVE|nr:hypothetical protein AVEN_117788-1 [Araneus ventricosus]